MSARRPMLFYSDWPLGYHNQEAERKARAFGRDGYDVVYVAGVGVRNPRLSSAAKVLDRVSRKVRDRAPAATPAAAAGPSADGLRSAGLLVAPPRQVPAVRRANVRWVERQMRATIADWPRAVAWIRHATPELVEALDALNPAVTIYESVDAHHVTPGMTGIWRESFERAERALVERADAVVVTSRSLAPRFEAWGADVRFITHGVDLFPFPPARARAADELVAGFVGVLDIRLDQAVLRHIATARPGWRLRLIGPVENGFDPAAYSDLPNVSIEPPIPHSEVGARLGEFDVGLMAYADLPVYQHMSPLKNLELLAAGKPAVARPTPALEAYGDMVRFAETPDEFVVQLEQAVAEDSPERAAARRARAEANTWDSRIAELEALLDEVLAR
ncbi:MAG: glycosyltransferase family protein [Solirubrobacteraceae bacterium]